MIFNSLNWGEEKQKKREKRIPIKRPSPGGGKE